MMKKRKIFVIFALLTAFNLQSLYSENTETQNIDYGKFRATLCDPVLDKESCDREPWSLGFYAFNSAPELIPYFKTLRDKFNVDTVVETGTFKGCSTVAFALIFDDVHTIEISTDSYNRSKENLKPFENVTCYLGSSEKVLREKLPALKSKPVLFYLDAHWESHWPLLEELDAIAATHRDNCIIVIDDFKVPSRNDIPYDHYGDKECSYEYVKAKLDQVYSRYVIKYLIPKHNASRAKLVAYPEKWNNK